MKQTESVKRIVALWMEVIGLALQLLVYAFFWFRRLYPILSAPRFTAEGFFLGEGLKLYFRGHLLVLLIYFMLLFFFARTYGGLQIGYLKPLDVFSSQVFALLIANVITYFQLSLMRNWLIPVSPLLYVTALQLLLSFAWTMIANAVYVRLFPPRRMLLVSGDYPTDDILRKFRSRADRYCIEKCVNISEGEETVAAACTEGYGGVVLWDIPTQIRNRLIKHCYTKGIRVYVMPKIPDVLLKGADQMHLFDTPLFLIREYSLRIEQRFMKRVIDLVCAVLLTVITSPVMLLTAIAIKLGDGGPVFYRQIRCTQDGREFEILKFRSMRMDAEKDGVARLAAKGDTRITPVGRIIRPCRIDELPQLINILKGDMSFIGPRPERPEIIARYMEDMPEFQLRMKVKAGLAGYAQVYGKYNTTPYDKLKLDLTYIENYSVWLDLKLMLLTLKILFTPDAAEGFEEGQADGTREKGEAV